MADNISQRFVENVSSIDNSPQYRAWDAIPPSTLLNDNQARLHPPSIRCVLVSSQQPYVVSINNLARPVWDKSVMDHLVLGKEKKQVIKRLVPQYMKNENMSIGDVVSHKGKGLAVVLFGPPGVGKTLTVEAVAQYSERPLLPLSIGSLLADQSKVEDRLVEVFENCSRWRAILLLDEADVVLEARSYEDVRRNGIVSIFLQYLEYYEGILFLTTIRIQTMDPAFQSRNQVAIEYKGLEFSDRKDVWANFLKSKDVKMTEDAKAEVFKYLDDLAEYELNGRLIRNCFNIAECFALSEFRSPSMLQLTLYNRLVFFRNTLKKKGTKQRELQVVYGNLTNEAHTD